MNAAPRTDSIYLTDSKMRARDYAIIAGSLCGKPSMLIEINAEGLDLVKDELDKISMRYAGVISPERFRGVTVFKEPLRMGSLFRGRY